MRATHTCTLRSSTLAFPCDLTPSSSAFSMMPPHNSPGKRSFVLLLVVLSTAASSASTGAEDGTLMQTILSAGRADLGARDASNGRDLAVFAALEAKLNRAPMGRKSTNIACGDHRVKNPDQPAAESAPNNNPLVFPRGGEFHRRTAKRRRRRIRKAGGKAEAKAESKGGREDEDGQPEQGSDPRTGPDGLTAGTAKVKWFCGALERTAERLSGRRGGGAEAFLLSVFEDYDRCERPVTSKTT